MNRRDWQRPAVLVASFFCFLLLATSCKDDDDDAPAPQPVANGRVVKYEITGNYTGLFTIVYINASGGNDVIEDVRLPWSLTLTMQAGVSGAGFGSSAKIGSQGTSGQTAVARIYLNATEKGTSSGTANGDGYILSLQPPGIVL